MLPMLLPDAVTVWDVPAVKLRLLVERVRDEPPPFTVTDVLGAEPVVYSKGSCTAGITIDNDSRTGSILAGNICRCNSRVGAAHTYLISVAGICCNSGGSTCIKAYIGLGNRKCTAVANCNAYVL